MRDRLIELIWERLCGGDKKWAGEIADYLLENGVIVPPCKVGDTLYVIGMFGIMEMFVDYIEIHDDNSLFIVCEHKYRDIIKAVEVADFSITVFLTKEEAEAALRKERSK